MTTNFGWKAAIAVTFNAAAAMLLFRRELAPMGTPDRAATTPVPLSMVVLHLAFLGAVVVFAHHTAIFMGLFLFFLGFSAAYERYQNPLILREALLVAFSWLDWWCWGACNSGGCNRF